MEVVNTLDIDGTQWEMQDQEARSKIAEQDTSIKNISTKTNEIERDYRRFFYDAGTEKDVLQNRIDAMIYCYNNSKSGIATIRYKYGYYHNVIMPAVALGAKPNFIEIDYQGNISIIQIKNNQEYTIVKTI